MSCPPETKLLAVPSLTAPDHDGIVLVAAPGLQPPEPLRDVVLRSSRIDTALETETAVLPIGLPVGRVVYSPTGPIDKDYDDVRVFKDAAFRGVKRALRAGCRRPLLVLQEHEGFENASLVALLGALDALYTPLQVREHDPSKSNKVELLGVYHENIQKANQLITLARILESGRRVARDIGDCDPERMAPPRVEEYVRSVFKDSNVGVQVISDVNVIEKDYPLFEAVNRAANVVERHRGRIIYLEYKPVGEVKETLFLVGKGVTYDTGGADLKVGGAMLGMSRDKCGAAAVAGFMQVVRLLQPEGLRVVAGLSLVRNSIGPDSYVSDEVITARSGARVRVINTDAEGRMVMADVLCKFKELAVGAVNPHLFTIATLTGHAVRAVGDGYSIVMDNGPARSAGTAGKLQKASEKIGDPFEISTIRREDFSSHRGEAEGDDVIQGKSQPSTQTNRGHQGPAAFLIIASGLDKHGTGSDSPLKYSHLDIAASSGSCPEPATGAPILALAQAFLPI